MQCCSSSAALLQLLRATLLQETCNKWLIASPLLTLLPFVSDFWDMNACNGTSEPILLILSFD